MRFLRPTLVSRHQLVIMKVACALQAMVLCFQVSAQRNTGEVMAQSATWDLPGRFESGIAAATPYGPTTDLFILGTLGLVHSTLDGPQDPFELSQISGWPKAWSQRGVDAAFTPQPGLITLTQGRQAINYDLAQQRMSFPKSLGLPTTWKGIDGAAAWNATTVLITYGNERALYNPRSNTCSALGKLSDWPGWPNAWSDGVDDIVEVNGGMLYFFRGKEVLCFDIRNERFVGMPRGMSASDLAAGQAASASVWCALDAPVIAADAEQAKLNLFDLPVVGGSGGINFKEPIQPSARLAEIRVWGRWQVNAIQAVLAEPNGQLFPQAVHGQPQGTPAVFKLDPGECLKAVSGAYKGSMGEHLHAIRFTTTSRTSPTYGAAITKAMTPFSLELPYGAVFAGFTGRADTYVNAIGVQCASYIKPELTPEQLANIDPYIEDVIGGNADSILMGGFVAEGIQLMAEGGFYKGYNLLYIDPLEFCSGKQGDSCSAPYDLFEVQYEKELSGYNRKLFPLWGSRVQVIGSADCNETKTWVTRSSEVSSMTSFNISSSVSVDLKLVSVGSSRSYNQTRMNSSKTGSERVYCFSKCEITTHRITIDPWWQNDEGQLCRQKLTKRFRRAVADLPVPKQMPAPRALDQFKRGEPLPAALQPLRQQYLQLILNYGTSFPTKMSSGGVFIEELEIEKKSFESSNMTQHEFQVSVEASVGREGKKVGGSVGGGATFQNSYATTSENGTQRRRTYSRGGAGNSTVEGWNTTVAEAPAPIRVEFGMLFQLLDTVFFWKDSLILAKQQILREVLYQYLVDEGRDPVNPIGPSFFEPVNCTYEFEVRDMTIDDADDGGGDKNLQVFGGIYATLMNENEDIVEWTAAPPQYGAFNVWTPADAVTVEEKKAYPLKQTFTYQGKCADALRYKVRVTGELTEFDESSANDALGDVKSDFPLSAAGKPGTPYPFDAVFTGGDNGKPTVHVWLKLLEPK